eukprot:CAMPEP_0201690458 /NCGR_PEP_ID=MMETSP0578-20130828/3898_1 /ASSEMBLY_ACC=CAM_ASM_000663 /TAXON_ID=267565 /ORGANISM="Skeletonema grethea, Strain CCMP 1804" /LENGTH=289 /DNA_ID=CAMNT_0048175461 /DNA_START=96 /DNA_END=965 /DNA_ORIENTATION=+
MEADDSKELPPPSDSGDGTYTPDDLIDLVRAIKFAHPEMSMKKVHKEISGAMANADESYAFLKEVKLDEVKKVWKKALKNANKSSTQKSSAEEPVITINDFQHPDDGVFKFYTVGDGSVKTLAENYSKHKAEAIVAAKLKEELKKYTHFFLDVPAELSGKSPHQALISFNDNNKALSSSVDRTSDGREIFKIQSAKLPPGMEHMLTPMLLYNNGKKSSTFLHPPSPDKLDEDDGGYMKIKQMISESGTGGAYGDSGGQKAYFYGMITETEDGPNVVSIDTSELAPSQRW